MKGVVPIAIVGLALALPTTWNVVAAQKSRAPSRHAASRTKRGIPGKAVAPAELRKEDYLALQAAIGEDLRAQVNRYHGIRVRTHPRATGDDSRVRAEVRDLLEKRDLVPADRLEHFQWMAAQGHVITGWIASIEKMSTTPRGVVLELRVTPYSKGFQFADHLLEYYIYHSGRLEYLRSQPGVLGDARYTICL